MKKKLPLILLIVFIVGILCLASTGIAGFLFVKSTPQYSIYELGRSIKNKDYESFSKYFNSGDVVTAAVEEYAKTQDGDYPYEYGSYLSYLTTYIKDGSEQEFKKKVENGDLLEQEGVKQIINMNPVELFAATKVEKDGKIAIVTVNLGSDQVELKMRHKDGNWQIFEIKNWQKLVDTKTFKLGFTDLYGDMPSPSDPYEPAPEEEVSKNIGEEISTSNFTVTIKSSREAESLDSTYGEGTKAGEGAKFVFVDMKVTNTSKSSMYIDTYLFDLKDNQERSYDSEYSYYGAKALSYQSIAAGLSSSGEIAFEVPDDATGYSIQIHDTSASKTYTVKLK
jgi:hypothetical protein